MLARFSSKYSKLVLVEDLEEIRGEIRELRIKPAFLRRLSPYGTKEELEPIYQEKKSVTRIFEEMSFLFVFFSKKKSQAAAGA